MKIEFIIIGIVIVIGIIFLIAKVSGNKKPKVQVARQIKLDQLESIMEHLISKELEYDFFGITSKGTDCIYFADNNGKINIEFEVMANEQKPYVDKIKNFAQSNGFQIVKTTYGNKPQYEDLKEAPVYKLDINADLKTASDIGKQIMTEIFGNDMSTSFDIVP